MKSVTFIHAADIHLDSPMVGLQGLPKNIFQRLQESTFKAFTRVIDAALTNSVDFVILAGDLFDHEDRSIRAQIFLKKELERLEKEGIPVFLVHGNHDHLSGNWTDIKLPGNTYVFGSEVSVSKLQTKSDATVHLYGFSYGKKHVYERKIIEYQRQSGADFHIGILHGNMEGSSEHSNYAPFHLSELLEKEFDYWALGHIHKKMLLNEEPPIVYSGNTQGRNKKEKGAKGCYIVTLQEAGSQLQFVETSDVNWSELVINGANVTSVDGLYQICRAKIEEARREGRGTLAHIVVQDLSIDSYHAAMVDELLEILQEEEKEETEFVWPIHIQIDEALNFDKEELANHSDFYEELFTVMDEFIEFEETLAPLYKHPSARKLLSSLTQQELTEIKKEAEKLLIQKLIQQG